VYVDGKINDRSGEPGEGMVMDFEIIKAVWELHVKPILDHKDLNDQFMFVTTAENIASWMLVAFHDNGIPLTKIDLWETESCCATVLWVDVWGNEAMLRALTREAVA
jgi:6-pyruvoyl-tetrahydropterin synthase